MPRLLRGAVVVLVSAAALGGCAAAGARAPGESYDGGAASYAPWRGWDNPGLSPRDDLHPQAP